MDSLYLSSLSLDPEVITLEYMEDILIVMTGGNLTLTNTITLQNET
jgi:hypothetical protein